MERIGGYFRLLSLPNYATVVDVCNQCVTTETRIFTVTLSLIHRVSVMHDHSEESSNVMGGLEAKTNEDYRIPWCLNRAIC